MPRWASQLHKHKGLVLAFLLVLDKFTHASLHIPVKYALQITLVIKRSGYQAH